MGFDVTIPSKYNNKPVKELGPDSLSYLSYYSYHLTIPESITTIGTNAIGCSYSSMLTQKEELQINGTYSNTVVIENNKLVKQMAESGCVFPHRYNGMLAKKS